VESVSKSVVYLAVLCHTLILLKVYQNTDNIEMPVFATEHAAALGSTGAQSRM